MPEPTHSKTTASHADPLLDVLLEAASNYLEQRKGAAAWACAKQALERIGAARDASALTVLDRLAAAAQLIGRRDDAEQYWREALALQEQLGDHVGAAHTDCNLASIEKERGNYQEARRLLMQSLQYSAGAPPGEVRAAALEALCPVERRLGDSESAFARLAEAIRIREALGDTKQLATDHDHLGNICLAQGRLPEATQHYARALELYEKLELRAGIALVSNNLGIARMQRGEYDLANACFQRARSIFADLGDERRLAWTVGNLGLLESYRGNGRLAESLLLESVESLERIGDRSGQATFMNNLAPVYRMSGRLDEAVTWSHRAIDLMRELGQIEGSTQPWINLAVSELERHRLNEAEAAARQVEALAERSPAPGVRSEASILRALLALARRDFVGAIACATDAHRQATEGDHPRERGEALRIRGEAELRSGDLEAARASLQSAHTICKTLNDGFQLALCRLELGRLFLQVDAMEAAGRHLRQAADAFERFGHAARRWEALTLLARAEWPVSAGQARATLEVARALARSAARADLVQESYVILGELESSSDASHGTGGWIELHRLTSLARDCAHPEEFVQRVLALATQQGSLDGAYLELGPTADRRIPTAESPNTPARDLGLLSQAVRGSLRAQHLWLPTEGSDAEERDARPFALAAPVLGLERDLIGVLVGFGSESLTVTGQDAPRALSRLRALADLIGVIWRALEPRSDAVGRILGLNSERGASEVETPANYSGIVGRSRPMLAVFQTIERIAPTDTSVLIRGESGTGKELVARAIHERSTRRSGPFVAISCPSIPRELIEAELFGHEKGAYTGATSKRPGQIELADGGTLFLDEVGDMDLATQTKLLRFLQEREFLPVGSRRPVRVNIRLVAATSRNLEEEVRSGRLREDLYYRINVVPIRLPALRERPQDIPTLARHFLDQISKREGLDSPEITEGAVARLSAYAWPGNVRELRNVIELVVTLRRGEAIGEDDLPEEIVSATVRNDLASSNGPGKPASVWRLRPGETLETRLMSLEGGIIRETLESCLGNQSKAARILGLKESTMRHKMKRYGISGEASRAERRRSRHAARSSRRGAAGGDDVSTMH